MEFGVDLHADYSLNVGGGRNVTLIADLFNLTNRRTATDYDNCSDTTFGGSNPNFGLPINGCSGALPSYQAPLATRIGVRLDW
jgi:hypothetical protein